MTSDELIAKQQLEIERLKSDVSRLNTACDKAKQSLWRPEQWNPQCPDFPAVAMRAILRARDILSDR